VGRSLETVTVAGVEGTGERGEGLMYVCVCGGL
jgi:hypothetical protein